jgi:hypothetical protein
MKQVIPLNEFFDFGGALTEEMTYAQLFNMTDAGRHARSSKVRGPPLEIFAGDRKAYHIFNFKSYPSTTGFRHRGYIAFKKPRNGQPQPSESLPVEVDCTCFSGDTLVLMGDGTYKAISKIRPGDFVYTHAGRIRPVVGNVARTLKPGEKVFSVKISGFPNAVTVTENHPFYVLRGNETCRCGCGEQVSSTLFGRFNPVRLLKRMFRRGHHSSVNRIDNETIASVISANSDGLQHREIAKKFGISKGSVYNILNGNLRPFVQEPDAAPFAWVAANALRQREWFLSPWLDEGKGGSLDTRVARLLGYYAAEGCLTARQDVRFCFHLSEFDTLGQDVVKIAESLHEEGFGFRLPQRWRGKQGKVWRFNRYDGVANARKQKCFGVECHITPEFKAFISEHVGQYSRHKRLSSWFMSLDNTTLREFLVGLFLGDGTVNKMGHFRWTSVSKTLVWNVSTILRRLRVDHVITNCGHCLAVDVNQGDSAREVFSWIRPYLRNHVLERRCKKQNGRGYSRGEGSLKVLRKKQEITFKGEVWDLCVEEDHSFIVAGIAVANCPDYRYRWAWANKQKGAGKVGPQSLNKCINRAPVSTNPAGKSSLCKHLVAAKNFIWGLIQRFPTPQEPVPGEVQEPGMDVSWKIAQLVKKAQDRYDNYDVQKQQAARRMDVYRQAQQARNIQGPMPQADVPRGAEDEVPTALPPGQIPAEPESPLEPPLKPPTEDENKKRAESLVVRSNSQPMNTEALKKTKALVVEMEDDLQAAMGDVEGGGPAADVPPPPSEDNVEDELPPITAGEDQPEDEALQLLRSISVGIERLANELAPDQSLEDEVPGDEDDQPPGEDEEGGEDETGVPPVEGDDDFQETMPVQTGA